MKGIILAGGMGTRLLPMTKVTNKHLLPVYDRPMVYFPIGTLVSAGINEIMIVTGPENAGSFMNLLGSGKDFGADFSYRLQTNSAGIADALSLCRNFAREEPVAVILGDNIFDDNFKKAVKRFKDGAMIFLKKVADPERFGVATIKGEKIIKIVEKPERPESDLAVTGFYIYDKNVWKIIKNLKPSGRGELEITDVNNWYLKKEKMSFGLVDGYWSDAGTVESLNRAGNHVRSKALGR
jgi:glucose-1-phosphate thymidylyltransferase